MAEDNTNNSSLVLETLVKKESEGGSPIKSSTVEARNLSNKCDVLPSNSLSSRRNSTGKHNAADSDQSITPHYLRASTGSCHDFCKYGRKHSSEPKPMRPLPQRIKKPLNSKLSPAVAEGTKVTVAKQRPSGLASDSEETQFQAPPEIIKDVVFLEPKEVEPSPMQDSSSEKIIPKTEKKTKNMPAKCYPPKSLKKPSFSKTLQGVNPDSNGNSDIKGCERNSDTKHGRKIVISGASRQILTEPPTASSTTKSSAREALNMRKGMSSGSTLAKNKNRMGKADAKTEEKVSEKTLHVIQMEGKDGPVEPAQDGDIIASFSSPPSLLLPESSSSSPSPDSYIGSNTHPSKTKPVLSKLDTPSPVKLKFRRGKVLDIPNETNGPRRLNFRKGRLSRKNQDNNMESKDKLMESIHDDHTISSSTPSGVKGGEDGQKGSTSKIAAKSKGSKSAGRNHQIRTPKKGNLIVTRVETPLPVKLKFRRGTVLNLQHENNGPRRLGFAMGRHLRENQESKSDGKKKNPKKKVEGGENSAILGPGKVVLRHQDVQQGKKDAQGLFNNVIEETASKLVETKKSKVKALVGAFETVISLQEKKPSSAHAVS